MILKVYDKNSVINSVKLRKKSKKSIFLYRGIFRATKDILRSEWKLECSRFFKDHFGTITVDQNTMVERYEVVMEVIFKYCIIEKLDNLIVLGWPKQKEPLEHHQYFTLKELICILTDHNIPDEILLDSILEKRFKIFRDSKFLVRCTKVLVKGHVHCLLNVDFKNGIIHSLYYFRKLCELDQENIYRVSPVRTSDQREYKRLLRLKEHIIKSLITNFGLI